MKHFLVVSGGALDDEFASRMLDELRPDIQIAADSGLEFFYRIGGCPDVIIGDFDSVAKEALEFFRGQPEIEFRELNPVKDDTDTESAIRLAISMGAEQITLLGGTGSRLDHVLGNMELLGIGLKAGVPITMLDAHNRIRMVQEGIVIPRTEQFGSYVSLLPYTEKVEHLTLEGFKYPLMDQRLEGFCSLGVSNEIVADRGIITFDRGILLVIESRDGER